MLDDVDRLTETELNCPFIMVHELYQFLAATWHLFRFYPLVSCKKRGPANAWKALSLDPSEENGLLNVADEERLQYWKHYNPLMGTDVDYSEYLPLGIYGDDARYNRAGEKIILVTANSILSEPRRP